VEQFPKLAYQSQRIERIDEQHFRVHGDLTLHGTTREVVLDVEYGGRAKDPWGNQRALFTAKASLDRRDFGLKWNQMLEAGGVLVGELVLLAAIALPLGLWFGSGMAGALIASINTETVRLPLMLSASNYAYAALVITTATTASALIACRKLNQLDLVGSLKARE